MEWVVRYCFDWQRCKNLVQWPSLNDTYHCHDVTGLYEGVTMLWTQKRPDIDFRLEVGYGGLEEFSEDWLFERVG